MHSRRSDHRSGHYPRLTSAELRTQLGTAIRRACANGAILPARPLLKPSQDHPSTPSVTVSQPVTVKATRLHVQSKDDLDRDLPSVPLGVGRKDGQDRIWPLGAAGRVGSSIWQHVGGAGGSGTWLGPNEALGPQIP